MRGAPTALLAPAYLRQLENIRGFGDLAAAFQEACGDPECLSLAQYAQLFGVTLDFKPDLIIELGRRYGNSTAVFTEAAGRLGCRVVSLDITDEWSRIALPRVKELVSDEWFRPLTAVLGDIRTFDFASVLQASKRVMMFWDAHGFEVAECVLGRVLPLLESKEHVVVMHDVSDSRYCDPDAAISYGGKELWTGGNTGRTRFLIGNHCSGVEQTISVIDFTTRNGLSLHSADHELHTLLSAEEQDLLEKELGNQLFSREAHWVWFSLNEKPGPFTFPRFEPPAGVETGKPALRRLLGGLRRRLKFS